MRRTPFHEIREDLILVAALTRLTLGLPHLAFKESTYALFFILEGKRSIKQDTRLKLLVMLGMYLRLLKNIIDEIPQTESIKVSAVAEYEKMLLKYPEVKEHESKEDVQHSNVE